MPFTASQKFYHQIKTDTVNFSQGLVAVAHWIFAIQYFRVALKLRDLLKDDSDSRVIKSKRIVVCANICFYTQIAAYFITVALFAFVTRDDDYDERVIWGVFEILNMLLPCVLLIISIQLMKNLIGKL